MSIAFLIILVILIVIFLILYPFIGAMLKDRRELADKTMVELYPFFFQTISDVLFDGKGKVHYFDDDFRCVNMMSSDESCKNMIIHFMYSAGNMIIELKYKYYHQELYFKHNAYNLRNSSSFVQRDLANAFAEIALEKIKKHQIEVTTLLNPDQIVNHINNNMTNSNTKDPLNIIEQAYNLSTEQKETVICVGYLIATANGEPETAFTEYHIVRQQLRYFNVSWITCRNRLMKDGEQGVLSTFSKIDKREMQMLAPFFTSLTISHRTGSVDITKVQRLLYYMSLIGISESEYEEIMQKHLLLMDMYFGKS